MGSDLHNSSAFYFCHCNLSLLDISFFLYQLRSIHTISHSLCTNHAHPYTDLYHHIPYHNLFWGSFKYKGVTQDTLYHHFRSFQALLHILSLYFCLEGIFLFLCNTYQLQSCVFWDCLTHTHFNSICLTVYVVGDLDYFCKDLYFLCQFFYSSYQILQTAAEVIHFFISIFLISKQIQWALVLYFNISLVPYYIFLHIYLLDALSLYFQLDNNRHLYLDTSPFWNRYVNFFKDTAVHVEIVQVSFKLFFNISNFSKISICG